MNEANEAVDKNPSPRTDLAKTGVPRVISLDQYECFAGVSQHVAELKEFISAQALQQQPTLLIGERGLRQEQIARVLHQASENWAQPFFSINAHSLSAAALHDLIFGSTGAIETIPQGTIYINELTRLPMLLQQRLAVFIEEQTWRARSGKPTGPRLIFATEWHPAGLKAENRIAYGLIDLFRHSSFILKPLRERSEDIPYLAAHLAARVARRLGKGTHEITREAMQMLSEYTWEKNIEELEVVLESAISSAPPPQVSECLLPSRIRYAALRAIPADGVSLPQLMDEYERNLIETALRQTGGNQTKASQLLGLRVQTLNMKLKRLAVSPRPEQK
jgi:DNA-binding NtrC family response regulator